MSSSTIQRLPRTPENPVDRPAETVDTKSRILDAAEELFMEHGFEATSLRLITTAAGVNLAAVNYHFGSKEELFQAVLTRRLDPMNQDRMRLLSAYEDAADGEALTCETIISAMFIPALKLARDHKTGGKNFLRLLGRAYADPAPFIREFLSSQYAAMIVRFRAAFTRALPHIPREELSWRLHFVMGALSYTLAGTDALKMIAQFQPGETENDEKVLRRLAPFLAAGLRSPVDTASDGHQWFAET
ncbi:MAG: TetR/AcrR family transcriptional regulator [Betaproteobacteria bacterium]